MIDLAPGDFLLIAAASVITAVIHGATGMAGGLLMVAILSHIIGIKQAVPVMACALIIGHGGRTALFWRETDWRIAARVLIFGCPSVVLGALAFKFLDTQLIALLFVAFLVASFPIKRWSAKRRLRTGPKLLSAASVIWGVLAGNVIGQGFFLAPFLHGAGLNRYAFIGTLSTVTFVISFLRLSVFGLSHVLTNSLLFLGIIIGVLSLPGTWLGRRMLKSQTDALHQRIIEMMTLILIINFVIVFLHR